MTIYNSPGYAARLPGAMHGENRTTTRMHETVAVPATLATTDTVNLGTLPKNAVVSGLTVKAATQLDSGGAPTLAVNVGVPGTPQLFMAASTAVGHFNGASTDTTMAPVGRLYRNTTGADLTVILTAQTAAATAVAGTLEVELSYFVEDQPGSPA